MMKNAKRLLSLALCIIMALSCFAGCQSSAGDEIIIGGIGPLTGTASSYGQSVRGGMQIAVDEINAAGGVNGVKLKMIFEDDEADGAKAKSAYEKLMDDGMQILIGAVTSGASVALNDLTAKDGILQITPSASQIEAADNPNSFRLCFTDPLQGVTMAEYAYQTLGYRSAAIIFNQDDSYSTGMKDAFKERWTELGGTIAEEVSFAKDATDFNAQMTKVAAVDADFLCMPIYAEKAAQIIITAKEKGIDLPFVGGDGMDGILNYLEGDNAKLAEGLLYLTPFIATDTDPKVASFVAAYEEKYGSTPDQFAADGYDAVYAAKLAIEKTGITSAAALDNAALVAAMTEIQLDGLTGSLSFTADGEPNKGAKFAKIVDGKYVAQ